MSEALALAKVMPGMPYGAATDGPATFAVALLVAGLAAIAASYLPARRAGRVDPASALGAG